MKARQAAVERKSKETQLTCRVVLDSGGAVEVISNGAVSKSLTGKPAAAKADATPEAASDESLRKAKTVLFKVHHKLADHTASRGHLRADAEVRTAIGEIVAALTPSKPAPNDKAARK